ncbi:MAG: hypothetical protein JWM68_870, partial [Verrucomicrobiales bacterium]|nr:hypothetical protein [Verrucomicrobiales bacterium]
MKLHGLRDWISEHRIASACGLALLLIVLLLFGVRYRAMWRLAGYKKQLVAQGEKLTIAELIPPLPKASNGGPAVVSAVNFLPRSLPEPQGMRLISPGVARVAWRETALFEIPVSTGVPVVSVTTNLWPLLEEGLQDSEKTFAELRAA